MRGPKATVQCYRSVDEKIHFPGRGFCHYCPSLRLAYSAGIYSSAQDVWSNFLLVAATCSATLMQVALFPPRLRPRNGLYPHRGQADRAFGSRPGVESPAYPGWSFPPLLREGLRRNEAGRVWVANDGPAVFLTLEVAWEHLINDEGYTVPVADREPHARGCACP